MCVCIRSCLQGAGTAAAPLCACCCFTFCPCRLSLTQQQQQQASHPHPSFSLASHLSAQSTSCASLSLFPKYPLFPLLIVRTLHMHCFMCLCIFSRLYKYSSLFHLVDFYLAEGNVNITAPLRTDEAITRYVSVLLNILPFFLSRAQCYPALLCCRRLCPKPQPYLERTSHSQDEKEGNRCRGERRVESLALL